jgi:hypothetical protein
MTGPYDRALGTCLVAPFVKTARCAGCWRHFKYQDDRCRALPYGSCMSALTVEVVWSACVREMTRAAATGARAAD